MKKLVIILILLLVASPSFAQKKWTLKECVIHALENNISIQQSELDVELADIAKLDAIGNFLPSLNGQASNSWNTGLTQNVVTGVLETQTARNSSYFVGAGLDLFKGLENVRRNQRAKINRLAADYSLDKMKDDISLFVANGYLQVLLNKANLDAITAQNEVTMEQLQRTMDLVDAGVLPRGDLLEIKATDASEKQNIIISENAVQISLINLAQLLQIEDYENFDIAEEEFAIIDEGISSKEISEIIESAKENRSEIKIAEKNVELAEKDLQIARAAFYPSVTAFINYNTRESDLPSGFSQTIDENNPFSITEQPIGIVGSTGEDVFGISPNIILAEEPPLPFMEQLYRNDGISYGIQMQVPIFNGFGIRNNVKRNKVNLKRQELLLEQAKLDLESNVYQAYVDAKGALKSYESAQVAVESQELAYQYAKDRYDVGLTNAFDFSQSKLRYDNARIELNRAKYDYIFKLKVLELYFGIPATELKI
ncbi:TolC family protein [Aureitalea sp. L0-47]|uniref:TolC family protein n=1 Tax=Aureitalea sp. L0-47 TaxID=2816962 RepID=UPI0022384054|nr:TolC family protein [Aureitalea sp. L0-47]MCW5518852.1 TolC family protein [Aureitalea sp. L0-47]